MNVFIEATGSLTSGYLIKMIQESGNRAIGSDISDFNHGKELCDDFIVLPKTSDPNLWKITLQLLKKHNVDIVIPSLDETMIDWANKVELFERENIKVIISPKETIEIFQDKWNTYNFFRSINIKTPNTSLEPEFEIIKPRLGRGGSGIFTNDFKSEIDMTDMISQEKITGIEYTVDTFFNKDGKPLYIVPRKRIDVKDGKSTKGIIIKNQKIDDLIIHISNNIKFVGPINFQLFETPSKELIFIEINPRIAGGMALGIAATENWITLIENTIIANNTIIPKPIKYGLKMIRYYDELFI